MPKSIFRKGDKRMAENLSQIQDLTRAFVLKEITAYQQHSVVSREIIRKPSGTMTVFAFDEGQGLSEHTAPFDAAVYILDGEVQIKIAGETHKVKAGEMIIMPANKPHALHAAKKFKMLLIMIK